MGALNTILAIIVVLAIVAILAVTVGVVLNNLPDSVKNVGAKQTQTPLFEGNELAGRIASAIGMPGAPDKLTVENLIIFIAIFVIMALALTEIIMMFSTFSTITSWIIGFAITLIAGAT